MKIKTTNGSYWVEEYGEKSENPLILLHGFTGSSNTWQPFIPFLKHRYVVCIDLPGHRNTDVQIGSMKDFCDDVASILTTLHINKATFIGYSLGGRSALSFAMYYPHRVKHLLLESGTAGLEEREERLKRQKSDEKLAQLLENKGLLAFVDKWENIPLFHTQQRLIEDVKKAIREERLAQTATGLAMSLRAMGTGHMPSWWDQLAHLSIPVQLIAGALDEKFVNLNRKMHGLLPNSSLTIVENVGHAIHVEQPEFFGTIIKNIGN